MATSYTKLFLVIVLLGIFVVSGCISIGGKDCGTDRACFDAALVACEKAKFQTVQDGRQLNIEILGESGAACKVHDIQYGTCLVPTFLLEGYGSRYSYVQIMNAAKDVGACTGREGELPPAPPAPAAEPITAFEALGLAEQKAQAIGSGTLDIVSSFTSESAPTVIDGKTTAWDFVYCFDRDSTSSYRATITVSANGDVREDITDFECRIMGGKFYLQDISRLRVDSDEAYAKALDYNELDAYSGVQMQLWYPSLEYACWRLFQQGGIITERNLIYGVSAIDGSKCNANW